MELLQELNRNSGGEDSHHSTLTRVTKRLKSRRDGGGSDEENGEMIGVESGVLVCDDTASDNLCLEQTGGAGDTDGELDDEDGWSKDMDRDSDPGKDDPGGGSGGGCDIRHVIVSVFVLLIISGAIALAVLTHGFMAETVYEIKYAWYYDNGMVLQRAPARSILWGTASIIDRRNTTIVIDITPSPSGIQTSSAYQADAQTADQTTQYKHRYMTNVTTDGYGNTWRVALQPMTDPGPYDITVYFSTHPQFFAKIRGVLFGDVWVCANQNKLQMDLEQLLNTSSDLFKGKQTRGQFLEQLNKVKFFSLTSAKSDMISYELRGIDLPWTTLTERLLHEKYQLPEVCLLFILELSRSINYPLALVTMSYADSRMEEWMPPTAMDSCKIHYTDSSFRVWNGMINPMLHVQLKGLIFMPAGELDNLDSYSRYSLFIQQLNCSYVELFSKWRQLAAAEVAKSLSFQQLKQQHKQQYDGERMLETEQWDSAASSYEDLSIKDTDTSSQDFHIAVIQGLPRPPLTEGSPYYTGASELRWAQTAGYGFLPNSRLDSAFIVPSIDLPPLSVLIVTPTLPPMHNTSEAHTERPSPPRVLYLPRYKEISVRLLQSILSTVYSNNNNNNNNVNKVLPRPTSYVIRSDTSSLTLYFEAPYSSRFHLLDVNGFEVCCTYNASITCDIVPYIPSIKHSPIAVQSSPEGTIDFGRDWRAAPITTPRPSTRPLTPRTPSHEQLTLSTMACPTHKHVVAVRYAWKETPCPYFKCALYGPTADESLQARALPMLPFLYRGPMLPDGQKRTFTRERVDLNSIYFD